ncbi:hypothetical protein ASG43_12355 [Aureimonas sp. Leaf454]|uniref:hypothetical protein n=1 Tax=Aureimonas sp. Leaf454 TaxID=1736381 RepID=UPI0007144E81|nr:hypothetical protein [Aureimonas sp. Leaf454]KQT45091.1 hypothetical protein ASG43_12355 [Aureimonas sp. Leaf454]
MEPPDDRAEFETALQAGQAGPLLEMGQFELLQRGVDGPAAEEVLDRHRRGPGNGGIREGRVEGGRNRRCRQVRQIGADRPAADRDRLHRMEGVEDREVDDRERARGAGRPALLGFEALPVHRRASLVVAEGVVERVIPAMRFERDGIPVENGIKSQVQTLQGC